MQAWKKSNDWRIFILFANLLPDIFVVKVDFLPFKFKFTESSNSYISLLFPSSKVNFMCCFLKRIMNNSSSASRLFGKHYISLDTFLGRPLQKSRKLWLIFSHQVIILKAQCLYKSVTKDTMGVFFRSSQGHGRRPKRKLLKSLLLSKKKKTFQIFATSDL